MNGLVIRTELTLISIILITFSLTTVTANEPVATTKAEWSEQKGYSLRPFVGLGAATLAPVDSERLGTGVGFQLDLGLLNEFKLSESFFFRLRPAFSLRNYGFEIGSTEFSYYNFFFRLGLGAKKQLSRRWALFLDLNPQVALGRGYCSVGEGDTSTYEDDDWDDWDIVAQSHSGTSNSAAFEADKNRVCGDLSSNLVMFKLGVRGGATFRLSNRTLLEGYIESENQANESKLVKGSSHAVGVLFNFIAF